MTRRTKFRELNYSVGADGQMTQNFARRIKLSVPNDAAIQFRELDYVVGAKWCAELNFANEIMWLAPSEAPS